MTTSSILDDLAGDVSNAPLIEPDFASIVWPLTPGQFFRDYWGKRCFVSHGPPSRLAAIEKRLGPVDDPPALVRQLSDRHEIWGRDLDGRHIVVQPASVDDSIQLYNAGLSVYYSHVRELAPWTSAISSALAVDPNWVFPGLFVARRSGAIGCHFDKHHVFTVQVRGRKTWRVARNEHVQLPTIEHIASAAAPPALLNQCTRTDLPTTMPDGSESVELRPGSVFYVPSGMWHDTATTEDSMSIPLTCRIRSWAELVGPALMDKLLSDVRWRAEALGGMGDRAQRAQAQTDLAALLDGLRADLPITPTDVIPPLGTAAAAVGSAREVFELLARRLRRDPRSVAPKSGVHRVVVTDVGAWTLDLDASPASITRDSGPSPELTLELTEPDLVSICANPEAEAPRLFLSGRLALRGNTDAALRLLSVFKLVADAEE